MSDRLASEEIRKMAQAICDEFPKVRQVVNQVIPSVADTAVRSATGDPIQGLAARTAATAWVNEKPKAASEVAVGLALTPVMAAASIAVAPIVVGVMLYEGACQVSSWLGAKR